MSEITENAKKRKPKEKRLSRFGKAVIIYAVSLTALLAILIGVLSAFLYTYEKNLPEKTAEEFVSSLSESKLAALLENALGSISVFEDGALLLSRAEYLSGEIRQAKLAREYTASKPVYRLVCGENDIGKLSLKRAETDAAFGLARWEVDSTELYKEALPGGGERMSLTLCVPNGAELSANGRTVSAEYIAQVNVRYSGKCVLAGYDGMCDIYKLEGLCTLPELTVTYMGEISALSVANGTADWFAERERAFILTLPSDASVTVSGNTPDPALATRGHLTEAVSEFEKDLGEALPVAVSYLISGSKDESSVSVSVHGKELEGEWFEDENGLRKLVYLYSDESKYKVRAILPRGATLYINGVPASEEYISGTAPFPSLEAVEYLSSSPEKLSGALYEIDGLLCEPQITAEINGTLLPLCSLSKDTETFTADFYGSAEAVPESSAKQAAEAFTRAYFHYAANGAVGIEENYNALISMMKPSSPGYKQIKSSKSSFEFVNQGVYRIDLISPKNFIPIGDNLFFCEVDFSVLLRFYRNEKLYEGTLSLIFVREGDQMLVCDMAIDSFN